jgi:hypothetical protein
VALTVTLVLNLLTRSHVIQVSDRRLVWFRGGEIQRSDDEQNKAVMWAGRLAFAYTGLAELGRERRTDLWLASALNRVEESIAADTLNIDQGRVLAGLAEEATAYFAGPKISHIKADLRRHAFVAIGWARFNHDPDFTPYLALVSNFHGDDWQERPSADPVFRPRIRPLGSHGGFVLPVGHALSREEIDGLADQLSRVDGDPPAAIEILGEKIRQIASRTRTVGRGLMANVLPRGAVSAAQTEFAMLAGPPSADTATFLYVPPDDEPRGVVYGPTYARGGAVLSNLTIEAL